MTVETGMSLVVVEKLRQIRETLFVMYAGSGPEQ